MGRPCKSIYQVILPVKSQSTVFDDIPGINKTDYYASQIGDALTISEFLRCSEHSVKTCAGSHVKLKGCTINAWDRCYEYVPYAVMDRKTLELKAFNNVNVFPLDKLSKVIHYSESYIMRAASDPTFGTKSTWKNERIVKIHGLKIRHYVIHNGKDCDYYMLKWDDDEKEYQINYE